ncbi:hypothetical protein ACIQ6Y_21985 [Streptomyces sp. NPDC096205]|uniref:hypothetical protein n=1 Tax=Streptomyces sp. NPDC096205 TaxID=3366081 RepID=UPI003818A66A
MDHRLASLVVRHTRRVPVASADVTWRQSLTVARQLDGALMSVGFKLSAELLEHLAGLPEATVVETARHTLDTVREMVGDHVRHNTYFRDFPANVPDTYDFWMRCITEALADEASRAGTLDQLSEGVVDLLTLPSYGRYQHTYEDMLAAHAELIPAAGDRVTVLHLGGTLESEATALYLALAGSVTPLGEEHLGDLRTLAGACAEGPQPAEIPVRENRAIVNAARLKAGCPLLLDTVTDVLRLACALSDGDVTLREPTRFARLSRPARRALIDGLDAVVEASPAKLADVAVHRERWKRLGERLHPHEYPRRPHAAAVFEVARGERRVPSLDSRVEELLAHGDVAGAAELLATAPGRLYRSLDRLLRTASDEEQSDAVVAAARRTAGQVSGRVLLSVREHLHNRSAEVENDQQRFAEVENGRLPPAASAPQRPATPAPRRVFVNRAGGAWVAADGRPPVPDSARKALVAALDAETARRLPDPGHLLVEPEMLDVALPLSGRAAASGFGVLPRGSVSRVEGELLRFFMYWKQSRRTTDYDLSALLLSADHTTMSWLSWTALTAVEGVHSGDITEAPDGASEFIDLRLGAVRGAYIVPQVNVYSGEDFEEVEESFFGFMLRDAEQQGRPFEPRTVRLKSELRGPGRVALPLVFARDADGRWHAKWLHVYLKGHPSANRVEGNRVTVAALLRGVMEHESLTVRHLVDLLAERASSVTLWDGTTVPPGPVTFLGLTRPEGLHPNSRVVTPENLRDMIPA